MQGTNMYSSCIQYTVRIYSNIGGRRKTKKVFFKIKIYQTLKINGKKKKVDGKLIIYIRNYNIYSSKVNMFLFLGVIILSLILLYYSKAVCNNSSGFSAMVLANQNVPKTWKVACTFIFKNFGKNITSFRKGFFSQLPANNLVWFEIVNCINQSKAFSRLA